MNHLPEKETISCFICGEDITNKTKCLSFFNYPDKVWNETTKNWDGDFRKLFNKAMCQKCSKKDLEVAHLKATGETARKSYEQKLKVLANMPWYKRLFL